MVAWLLLLVLALSTLGYVFTPHATRTRRRMARALHILASLAIAILVVGIAYVVIFLPGFLAPSAFAALAAIASGSAFVGLMMLFVRGETVRRAETEARPPAQPKQPPPRDEARATPPSASRGACDVFISYRRDERAEVVALAQRLETLRLRVWFDAELRSGTAFDSEIEWHARNAQCVLVCWSPGAVGSEWVRAEATIGRQRSVLAACMLKPCDLPPPFNLLHAEDLSDGAGPHNDAWLKLLERVGALTGRPGLAAYEAAQTDRGQLAAWLAAHPNDPLFDSAVAQLRS